jgi:seryl-tRNA synthetase
MFDIRLIVNEKEKVLKSLASKNFKDVSIINRAEELYNLRKKIVFESENIRAIQKQKSKEMPVIMKNGTSEEKAQIKEELKNLSEKVKSFAPKLKEVDNELEIILLSIPNKLADDVPIGKDETENIEIKKWGEKPNFSFKAKEHFDLMNKGLDLERASKLSGARFVIYSGELAQLERAVMNFMLDTHKKAGYIEVVPPILVNRETMTSSGQLPKFEEDAYKTTDDMFLIPTAEVSLVNLHRNEIIPQKNLPLKYTAYTPCFRREAGSYGKDTRGIIRLHQFNKVELVQFVKAEESWKALDEILSDARKKYFSTDPSSHKEAVERLWDAWERLKTLEVPNNKRKSISKLLDMAATENEFRKLLEEEATELTTIGNKFHIRHAEIGQIEIERAEHFDYLFHRLLSMILLLIKIRA